MKKKRGMVSLHHPSFSFLLSSSSPITIHLQDGLERLDLVCVPCDVGGGGDDGTAEGLEKFFGGKVGAEGHHLMMKSGVK
jgi:hypothetical protein